MTTKPRKRRTTTTTSGTTGARRTTRRRASTASTLGTAAGAALAGVLYGLIGSLPWWAWVGLILLGLAVGYVLHRRSATATGVADTTP